MVGSFEVQIHEVVPLYSSVVVSMYYIERRLRDTVGGALLAFKN